MSARPERCARGGPSGSGDGPRARVRGADAWLGTRSLRLVRRRRRFRARRRRGSELRAPAAAHGRRRLLATSGRSPACARSPRARAAVSLRCPGCHRAVAPERALRRSLRVPHEAASPRRARAAGARRRGAVAETRALHGRPGERAKLAAFGGGPAHRAAPLPSPALPFGCEERDERICRGRGDRTGVRGIPSLGTAQPVRNGSAREGQVDVPVPQPARRSHRATSRGGRRLGAVRLKAGRPEEKSTGQAT